jgi:hypothetical protein
MSVPLLRRKCNRFDCIEIILQAHRYEAFRCKKSAEAMFTGGPEHAISYTWQLASDVAIIYPDSRLYSNLDL